MDLINYYSQSISPQEVLKYLNYRIIELGSPKEFFIFSYLINLTEKEIINHMDKKMAKVTKEMKTAEKDVKKGKKTAAVKTLKKAEKKNVKLTKIDRDVRDPMLKKCKKVMKKAAAKGKK